ncbi:unnamed protein product, partial [Rotaria sp. Silwood2]
MEHCCIIQIVHFEYEKKSLQQLLWDTLYPSATNLDPNASSTSTGVVSLKIGARHEYDQDKDGFEAYPVEDWYAFTSTNIYEIVDFDDNVGDEDILHIDMESSSDDPNKEPVA